MIVIITAYTSAGLAPGLSALGTSLLSFVAGGGLRGSLYGTRGQIIAGACLSVIFMAIAHSIGGGFSVHVYGKDLTGTQWGWLGFFICFLLTPKRMALA